MKDDLRQLELLKRFHDSRCPKFGGYEYKGYARGMGRLLLLMTLHALKLNGKVVLSNGAY